MSEQKQVKHVPIVCPICQCTKNRITHVIQLFKHEHGPHRPTIIIGPGMFSSRDFDVPIGCTGPAVVIVHHCPLGHTWAMTLREDHRQVFCTFHRAPDWQKDTVEPKEIQSFVDAVTKLAPCAKLIPVEAEKDIKLPPKKKNKKKPPQT